jgi:GMP synthase-like glutamine amidotransferase
MKTKFNLVVADNNPSEYDLKFIEHVIGPEKELVVIDHTKKDIPENIDLILFTGGEDVFPILYGENIGNKTYVNSERDSLEQKCFNKFSYRIPKLGICRGSQFLTVMNGGKLIQHVENHGSEHLITTNTKQEFKISSSHHQMMYPYNLSNERYELIAHSTYFRSNTYLNGENKEIELPKNFLEPEIIFYSDTNSLCIQGHPEWMSFDSNAVKFTKNLINNKLFKNNKNEL